MNATKSMYHYKGGIFSPSPEECNYESLGSHSMEVIGYGVNDKEIPYWILKNSWGSGYGINGGYLHMRRYINKLVKYIFIIFKKRCEFLWTYT